MHWRVELLGELRVSCGEKVVTRLESRKVVALLARLALQPQRPHTREELADLLWPESDRETGLARLRHALSSLRRTLVPNELTGEGFFTADRQSVRVRPGSLSCDVSELERALGQKRWSVARALYKGELLPGFWDDWLCVERERLQALVENLPETQEQATPTPEPLSDSRRLRLPGYLTRFTGREVERTQLAEMLQSRRLVTLLGPGGIGKTRLATELAQAHASHFAVVAFVPLAECFDATQLQDRVRGALQLSGGERSALEQLIPYLHEQPTLLVLDNLEQLIESGGAEAIEQLLFALPSVRCIVTSRRVLDIAGEQVFPLSPLPQAQSLALFLDRAQAARPDFTL
uniref:AAA family ATPase n=1 Tax=Armatimonas sp. TaxID=1872638 RepID=UPI00286C2E65